MLIMKIAKYRRNLTVLLLLVGAWGGFGALIAQDAYYSPPTSSMTHIHDTINQVRHGLNNHEHELRQNDEKFNSMESILDNMQRQLQDHSKTHKEHLHASKAVLDSKVGDLELVIKGLLVDLNQIKSRVNESVSSLSQYKQQLTTLEKAVEVQNQNIESLHSSMKTLMQVLQGGENAEATAEHYTVKSGDNLEKIAIGHSTTVKAIKELNSLATDRIKIGQKLKLPTK
jgi:LysM repeat protein